MARHIENKWLNEILSQRAMRLGDFAHEIGYPLATVSKHANKQAFYPGVELRMAEYLGLSVAALRANLWGKGYKPRKEKNHGKHRKGRNQN